MKAKTMRHMTGPNTWMRWVIVPLVIAGTALGSALAGEKTVETGAAPEASAKPDFWSRTQLTGDWGGARSWLKDRGLSLDLDYTSFYQSQFSGAGRHDSDHSGRVDLVFNVDTEKLGLWKGGGVRTHTHYRYGRLNTHPGGVLWPVNVGQTLPLDAPDAITVTSHYLTQKIGKRATLMLGKINAVDLLAPHFFYGGWGTRRFMNIALVAPPTGLVPPVIMGGLVSLKTDRLNWILMAYDPHDRTRDYWPDGLFKDGVIFNVSATHATKLAGRTTTYKLGGIVSTQEGMDLRDTLLPPDLQVPLERGAFNVNGEFSHRLYESKDRPGSGWGIAVRAGFSDGNPNPIAAYVSGGIGGTGPFPSRRSDSFGVGYFYYNFSDELKSGLHPYLEFGDEQGGEFFYDFAVTPWFHVAADLQIIGPAVPSAETVVVGALRGNLRF